MGGLHSPGNNARSAARPSYVSTRRPRPFPYDEAPHYQLRNGLAGDASALPVGAPCDAEQKLGENPKVW
jgi:hypothetical protein